MEFWAAKRARRQERDEPNANKLAKKELDFVARRWHQNLLFYYGSQPMESMVNFTFSI